MAADQRYEKDPLPVRSPTHTGNLFQNNFSSLFRDFGSNFKLFSRFSFKTWNIEKTFLKSENYENLRNYVIFIVRTATTLKLSAEYKGYPDLFSKPHQQIPSM